MKRLQAIQPDVLNYLLGYLALLIAAILFSLAATRKSGIVVIDDVQGDAHLHFEADRAFMIWPDDCVRVQWKVDHVKQITLNDEPLGETGKKGLCLGEALPYFVVGFPSGAFQQYTLGISVVSQPYVIGSLILPAVIIGLMALFRRWQWPAVAWVFGGFAIPFVMFFVIPIFFNATGMIFPKYVLAGGEPGQDLREYLGFSRALLQHGVPYVESNIYPPLQSILFAPLTLLTVPTAYAVITAFTLIGYTGSALLLPTGVSPRRQLTPLLTLLFATGIISYGVQFELERGQFNVIAMTLCFGALYLFHFHPRLRALAYALFVISVQLKLYPLIFLILFVRDWRQWKDNIRRFALLIAANVACFFVLGVRVLSVFISRIPVYSSAPFIWKGNTSITSFVARLPAYGMGFPGDKSVMPWVFLILVATCSFVLWWKTYRANSGRLSPHLLLVCTVAVIVIPPISHDYKLSILAPAAAILLDASTDEMPGQPHRWLWQQILIFLFALAYATTLFSYATKTGALNMNFLPLMTMLIVATVMAVISSGKPNSAVAETQDR